MEEQLHNTGVIFGSIKSKIYDNELYDNEGYVLVEARSVDNIKEKKDIIKITLKGALLTECKNYLELNKLCLFKCHFESKPFTKDGVEDVENVIVATKITFVGNVVNA